MVLLKEYYSKDYSTYHYNSLKNYDILHYTVFKLKDVLRHLVVKSSLVSKKVLFGVQVSLSLVA